MPATGRFRPISRNTLPIHFRIRKWIRKRICVQYVTGLKNTHYVNSLSQRALGVLPLRRGTTKKYSGENQYVTICLQICPRRGLRASLEQMRRPPTRGIYAVESAWGKVGKGWGRPHTMKSKPTAARNELGTKVTTLRLAQRASNPHGIPIPPRCADSACHPKHVATQNLQPPTT